MWRKIWNFIQDFAKKSSQDGIPAYAAQVAFFVMLSFFPFIMLLAIFASKISFMNADIVGYILNLVPDGLEGYMADIINDVVSINVQSFTVVTVLISLWSAAKGMQTLSKGLNKIYGVEETKNFFIARLLCSLYTLIFMILCLTAMVLHVFGSQIGHRVMDAYPSLAKATLLILSLKNVFTFLIIFIFLLLMYYKLPNRKGHVRHELTGAAIAALIWMLMTGLFSLYIRYAAKTSKMYGSMTSLAMIVIWMYIGMQIVLYGAQINYYMSGFIEKERDKQLRRKAQKYGKNC